MLEFRPHEAYLASIMGQPVEKLEGLCQECAKMAANITAQVPPMTKSRAIMRRIGGNLKEKICCSSRRGKARDRP